jgi:RNA polymerase subunit RPABC4/transcription elongation factor Spt4
MNRFRDGIKVIPGPAWLIAFVVFACMFLLLFGIAIPHDPKLSGWPVWAGVLFSGAMAMLLFVYTLLVGYVNGDAKRRGMRRALWTVIAIFVPNGIGIILYFFMREPVLEPCPKCHALVRSSFAFCPNCSAQLRTACPSCRRPVEPGWNTCAFCGTGLSLTPSARAR